MGRTTLVLGEFFSSPSALQIPWQLKRTDLRPLIEKLYETRVGSCYQECHIEQRALSIYDVPISHLDNLVGTVTIYTTLRVVCKALHQVSSCIG